MSDQKPEDLVTTIEDVTPEIAESWLERVTRNRHLNLKRVKEYARQMKDGQWRLTGEAITFNKDGVLLNGQHRAAAVILSERTVRFVVMRGIPDEAVPVMDTGMARTLQHGVAVLMDDPPGQAVVSLAKYLAGGIRPSPFDIQQFLLANAEDLAFLKECTKGRRQRGVGGPVLAAIFATIHHTEKDKRPLIQHFVEVLLTGVSAGPADGTLIPFRDWLMVAPMVSQAARRLAFERTRQELRRYLDRVHDVWKADSSAFRIEPRSFAEGVEDIPRGEPDGRDS